MRKPIKLTVWLKGFPVTSLRFNSCAEAEFHLDGLRACPILGGQLQRFAIDKDYR